MLAPSSIAIPARTAFAPTESVSISSITLPIPKNIGFLSTSWKSWKAMIESTRLALFTGSKIRSQTISIPSQDLTSFCMDSTRSLGV